MFCNRIIIKEYQLPRGIMNNRNFLFISTFLSCNLGNLVINPFFNSKISAKHDKVERLSANGEILITGIGTIL